MRSVFTAVVIAASLALTGCGGDDSSAKSDPQLKCESFASTWCEQSIGCLVSLGKVPESQRVDGQSQCTDVAIAAVQCKKAVMIGGSYAQCMSDIRAMDCAIWNVPEDKLSTITPPSTCVGIIHISQ